mmetsp:Transcript_34237/g.82783  ORF Transcript_34237/g.82783 Transcript_34237/m.82783 type:complete len:139 (-) Transcript_34237:149-565(-)
MRSRRRRYLLLDGTCRRVAPRRGSTSHHDSRAVLDREASRRLVPHAGIGSRDDHRHLSVIPRSESYVVDRRKRSGEVTIENVYQNGQRGDVEQHALPPTPDGAVQDEGAEEGRYPLSGMADGGDGDFDDAEGDEADGV